MIDIKRIFPECNADTLLVELVLQRGTPSHYHGINNLGKALVRYQKNDFIIGVADTDKFKRKDPNIDKFTVCVVNKLPEENLIVYQLPESNKHIIRIHPEFEPWIWDLAKKTGIDPLRFGFDTYKKFEKAAKDEDLYDNKDLKKFVNAVIQQNPPAIQTLRYWLSKADPDN